MTGNKQENDHRPISGRRALVLGAGGPQARALAAALAQAGADVAVASTSLDGAEVMAVRRVRKQIEALGRRSAEYAFDVTLGANVQVSTRQVSKDLGGLDILVYAVDTPLTKAAAATTDAEWARVLGANLSGAFYACRAAIKEMTPGGWGRILLLVPDTQPEHAAPMAAYIAARAGLAGLAYGLAAELAGSGIHIHLLLPVWLADTAGIDWYAGSAAAFTGETPVPPATEPVDQLAALAVALTAGEIPVRVRNAVVIGYATPEADA